MRRALAILLSFCTFAVSASAQAVTTITNRKDPLVQQLEARYRESLEVAAKGDVEAYRKYRTAAPSRLSLPSNGEVLKMFSGMLPPLDAMDFVRVDSSGQIARAVYRWRRADATRFTTIVFRMEQGEWKIFDLAVKGPGR
jgi:hypothetical protein